jgi:O-antigen ligase
LLSAGFVLTAVGGCLDYQLGAIPWQTFGIAHWQMWITYGLLAVLLACDGEGPWRGRLVMFGGCVLGGLALLYLTHDLAHVVKRRIAIQELWRSPSLYLWLLMLWHGVPLLMRRRADGVGRSAWLRWEIGLLMLYGTLCLASAVAAKEVRGSLYFYAWERGLLFTPLLAWVRAAEVDAVLRRATARAVLVLIACLLVGATVVALVDEYANPILKDKLVEWRLVYQHGTDAGLGLPERRLLFPMLHFNRTGYFGLTAMMLMLAVFCGGGGRRERIHYGALLMTVLGMLVALLSQTRGAIIAGLIGLVVWGIFCSPRIALAMLVGCLLLPCLLPARHRQHLLTVFAPSTYDLRGGEMTSMKTRILVWEWGLTQVRERPVTGMGFGTDLVQKAYETYVMREGDPRVRHEMLNGIETVHVHNLWLETAVESGVPTMVVLFCFLAGRWWLLVRWWRRERDWPKRQAAAWLALEASLMVAGLVLYMLKNNSGFLNWFIWCYILLQMTDRALPQGSHARVVEADAGGAMAG